MDKTVPVIIVVVIAAFIVYLMMPEGLPGLKHTVRLIDTPSEGNGIIGRFISFVADLSWTPAAFAMTFIFTMAALAGLTIYWRRIRD